MKRPLRLAASAYPYLFPKWFRVGATLLALSLFLLIGLGMVLALINFQPLP